MRFWDSSAVVPLVVPQRHTAAAEAAFDADPSLVVWWATPVECASALARLEREGGIDRDALATALERLRRLGTIWNEVQPGTRVRDVAQRLLRAHSLRAADALQLAAALEFAEDEPSDLELVCFDARLADAASRVGLRVLAN